MLVAEGRIREVILLASLVIDLPAPCGRVLPSAFGLGGTQQPAPKTEASTMGADDYEQITVYADPSEKRQIERNAEAAGMSVSTYLRERGLSEDAIADVSAREEEIAELRELRRLIGNVAGNINQIAHHANRQGQVSEKPARSAAQAAEQAADKIMDTLSKLY